MVSNRNMLFGILFVWNIVITVFLLGARYDIAYLNAGQIYYANATNHNYYAVSQQLDNNIQGTNSKILTMWGMTFVDKNMTDVLNNYTAKNNISLSCLNKIQPSDFELNVYGNPKVIRQYYQINQNTYSVELRPTYIPEHPIECGVFDPKLNLFDIINCSSICQNTGLYNFTG